MTYWTSSAQLLRETLIEGYLENVEPLRVGVGREPPLGAIVDLAVIRINYRGASIPYIPGSSLKGVFRSAATTLASHKGLKVCSGLSKDNCMELKILRDPEWGEEKLGKRVERLLREGRNQEAMRDFWENACLLCKIFGAPSYIGKVSFSDAYPIDERGNPIPVRMGVRTGIAIDRKTGAVSRKALYTVEYVEPGARFRFSIRCRNLPNYALGLLAATLKMVDSGEVKIGGFKTRGFGAVRVREITFKSRDYPEGGSMMKALDEADRMLDLSDLELREGWIWAEGDSAWRILQRLEEVWTSVQLKS